MIFDGAGAILQSSLYDGQGCETLLKIERTVTTKRYDDTEFTFGQKPYTLQLFILPGRLVILQNVVSHSLICSIYCLSGASRF
jgi:hypothetical protein